MASQPASEVAKSGFAKAREMEAVPFQGRPSWGSGSQWALERSVAAGGCGPCPNRPLPQQTHPLPEAYRPATKRASGRPVGGSIPAPQPQHSCLLPTLLAGSLYGQDVPIPSFLGHTRSLLLLIGGPNASGCPRGPSTWLQLHCRIWKASTQEAQALVVPSGDHSGPRYPPSPLQGSLVTISTKPPRRGVLDQESTAESIFAPWVPNIAAMSSCLCRWEPSRPHLPRGCWGSDQNHGVVSFHSLRRC